MNEVLKDLELFNVQLPEIGSINKDFYIILYQVVDNRAWHSSDLCKSKEQAMEMLENATSVTKAKLIRFTLPTAPY